MVRASRYIRSEDETHLKLGLRLRNSPTAIRRTLQRLCQLYESGRRLEEPDDHRQLIHSHLGSENVLLRRWSFKALGLISNPDDTRRIFEHLRIEKDVEAQNWGVAALLKNADTRGLRSICDEANIDYTNSLQLAARLYAPTHWLSQEPLLEPISLNADESTLRWAIFLIAYGRAPERLFDPRYDNPTFLGELNKHDNAEIQEYSVWALHENQQATSESLKIKPDEIAEQPENVRKWLYRFWGKHHVQSKIDPEFVLERSRVERTSGREGLALSIADMDDEKFDDVVFEWIDKERTPSVVENLAVAMIGRASRDVDAERFVTKEFLSERHDAVFRKRLLAASVGSVLYQRLHNAEAASQGQQLLLVNYGRVDMSSNTTSFNIGRDLNARNVAGGDVYDNMCKSIQVSQCSEVDRTTLTEILNFLNRTCVPSDVAAPVVEAIAEYSQEPSKEGKTEIFEKIRQISLDTYAAASGVGGVAALIDLVHHWAT